MVTAIVGRARFWQTRCRFLPSSHSRWHGAARAGRPPRREAGDAARRVPRPRRRRRHAAPRAADPARRGVHAAEARDAAGFPPRGKERPQIAAHDSKNFSMVLGFPRFRGATDEIQIVIPSCYSQHFASICLSVCLGGPKYGRPRSGRPENAVTPRGPTAASVVRRMYGRPPADGPERTPLTARSQHLEIFWRRGFQMCQQVLRTFAPSESTLLHRSKFKRFCKKEVILI